MFMGKIGPTALNFGYDFVLLVHFLGPVVRTKLIILAISGPFGAPQTQKMVPMLFLEWKGAELIYLCPTLFH